MAYVVTSRAAPLYQVSRLIWYVLDVVEALLFIRLILKLLGANAGAGFTNFIYSITYPLVAPFQAVFQTTAVSGVVFEWTTILAMIVYWLIAWAIIRLVLMGRPVSEYKARESLDEQDVV